MPRSAPFRLNRSGVLLALVSAAYAGHAGAVAGRAEFVIGNVTIASRDGVERPLQRGIALDNGDVVRTAANGRAQIRFTDGAYVSLQPNTEFGIRDYLYQNKPDGNERGFFGLIKGAMRTVTGLIGQINRDRYQITTPTATVGIRGTGGVIQVLDDGSTLVIGTSGVWSLTNPAGSIDVPAGTVGLSPSDPSQPPRETNQPPTSTPAPLPEPPLFVHEQRTEDGETAGLITPLQSGSGYTAEVSLMSSRGVQVDEIASGEAVFNPQGQLTSLREGQLAEYALVNGSHADFGTDGILAWGRWIGEVSVPGIEGQETLLYNENEGLHYVIGTPTATMPTSGFATYSLLGATRPTYTDGSTAAGTFTGSLDVNFGQQTVTLSFNIKMPDNAYAIGGTASMFGSRFSASTGIEGTLTVTGCQSACSSSVHGFFSGANAERAGVGYQIDDLKDVVGAAAFSKN